MRPNLLDDATPNHSTDSQNFNHTFNIGNRRSLKLGAWDSYEEKLGNEKPQAFGIEEEKWFVPLDRAANCCAGVPPEKKRHTIDYRCLCLSAWPSSVINSRAGQDEAGTLRPCLSCPYRLPCARVHGSHRLTKALCLSSQP